MKHVVVLTGAGISAESGLKTFRDANGLWEGHDVTQVATPEGFERNPDLVLEFYNQRRRQLMEVEPNSAHKALVDLERDHKITIITQNVDDLHEDVDYGNLAEEKDKKECIIEKPKVLTFVNWKEKQEKMDKKED